ncbi:MAG: ABC transporter permease, partial [Vulcanimicrobiaceae bacterium]
MIYFEEALRVLFANKVRSLLTMTGLIIGVGAVIAIQVLGSSMAGAVNGALGDMADNSFIVAPNGVQGNFRRAAIKLTDITAIEQDVPNIEQGIPLGGQNFLIQNGHHQARYFLTPDSSQPFNDSPLLYGRRFTS